MHEAFLKYLACPKCSGNISLDAINEETDDRIKSGSLVCKTCKMTYPIKNYIPRFVPEKNYADNFGYQWNLYTETQYDTSLKLPMSESRFYKTTNWPNRLDGELILEAGCGAGRFTEIALATNATVISFDYSSAVDANYKMNGNNPNLLILQADIFTPPIKAGIFDKVYCMGVIQHTPDPKKAFMTLPKFLKRGGKIAIDVYLKEGIGKWLTSYRRIHWLTRHMNVKTVHTLSKNYVNIIWPLTKSLWGLGRNGRRIARYVFLVKDRFWRKGLNVSDEVQKESLVLHFIDQLCAYYDNPQTLKTIQHWFETENLKNIEVFKGGNGVIGRGEL